MDLNKNPQIEEEPNDSYCFNRTRPRTRCILTIYRNEINTPFSPDADCNPKFAVMRDLNFRGPLMEQRKP